MSLIIHLYLLRNVKGCAKIEYLLIGQSGKQVRKWRLRATLYRRIQKCQSLYMPFTDVQNIGKTQRNIILTGTTKM